MQLRWVSWTPLGRPDVPEEKGIMATSLVETVGRSALCSVLIIAVKLKMFSLRSSFPPIQTVPRYPGRPDLKTPAIGRKGGIVTTSFTLVVWN